MIETVSLSKSYQTRSRVVHAVKNVDLRIESGEFAVIEGVSGSGKSTLLHLLGGMLRPSGGEVALDGKSLKGLSEAQLTKIRRDKVGFVFQSFNLIEALSARDNVELVMVPTGVDCRRRRRRALQLLEMVGLGERANHLPSKLSGGEQQRVAIARALANGPSIILADEPTGDLDSATGAAIVETLKALTLERGASAVVVTHSVYVAEQATRRFQMADGELHELPC